MKRPLLINDDDTSNKKTVGIQKIKLLTKQKLQTETFFKQFKCEMFKEQNIQLTKDKIFFILKVQLFKNIPFAINNDSIFTIKAWQKKNSN